MQTEHQQAMHMPPGRKEWGQRGSTSSLTMLCRTRLSAFARAGPLRARLFCCRGTAPFSLAMPPRQYGCRVHMKAVAVLAAHAQYRTLCLLHANTVTEGSFPGKAGLPPLQ